MTKIFVTGGSGFIGTTVVKMALDDGLKVVSFDKNEFTTLHQINPIETDNLLTVKGNILNYDLLKSSLRGCDAVIHLAAEVSVPYSFENPEHVMNVNVNGTQNVINAVKELGIKKLILASSAAVYGNSKNLPLNEEEVCYPQSPYAESKLQNELQAMDAQNNGIDLFCLRFFNVYGSVAKTSSTYSSVIPQFLAKILQNQPPLIYGDGTQTRDFIHVEDVSDLILKLVKTKPKKSNQIVFNVATQESTSLLHLIELIDKKLLDIGDRNKPTIPQYHPQREGDIVHSLGSIKSIQDYINWDPSITMEEGIGRLVANSLGKE